MMNYDMMSGAFGGGFMAFAWFTYVLLNVVLVLAIMALWKFVTKSNKQ